MEKYKIASFGLEIVHAAWMKTHATLSRLCEDDEELYRLSAAVTEGLEKLGRAVRKRSRESGY